MSNYKISKDDILQLTNGGLDIFRFYISDIDQYAGTRKKFKLHDENTPSSSIKRLPDGNYVVADFGDDGKWMNAIAYAQKVEALDYGNTIKLLAGRHGVAHVDQIESMYQPTFKTDDALPDQADGTWIFNPRDETPESHLRIIFSEKVWSHLDYKNKSKPIDERKKAVMADLRKIMLAQHWHSLESYTIIKKRKAITISAAEFYPIIRIEENYEKNGTTKTFSKIYQPKAKKKSERFFYNGDFDPQFLHGLMQVDKAYNNALNNAPEPPEGEERKEVKLEEIIYCTGGSDALNFAALGYQVIYPSSEYFKLSKDILFKLFLKTDNVYTCPDLDATGQIQNHNLCLNKDSEQYLNIRTIELPSALQLKRDQYGRPCKDFRDFLNHFTGKDLKNIIKVAKCYRFWDHHLSFDRSGKIKLKFGRPVLEYKLSAERVLNFLVKHGFGIHRISEETYEYVHIDGNIVRVVRPEHIKSFVLAFLRSRFMDEDLINIVHKSPILSQSTYDTLPEKQLDFKDNDVKSQYMFFENTTWRITPEGVHQLKPMEVDRMTWASKILPHKVSILDKMFTVTRDEHGRYDIDVHDDRCLFFRFLMQTSRVNWRTELEDNLQHLSAEEVEAYKIRNKFTVKGENLNADERYDQILHLVNKMYAFGYMMHRYKPASDPWIVMAMDDTPNKDGGSHGGSGKSIFFKALAMIKTLIELDGKNAKLFDDNHVFEQVNKNTDIVYIDDAAKNFPMERTFSMTTGSITVNPKGKTRITISNDDSPKMGMTTNFAPDDLSPSTLRRILFIGMSNYYHDNKMGEFNEKRQPKDDFDKELFKQFTPEEWNLTLNFMAQCCSLYLSFPTMIEAPMGNIMERNLSNEMGMNFLAWAEVYFSAESQKLDRFVPTNVAIKDYLLETGIKTITPQGFGKKLKSYAMLKGMILDPTELQGKDGRIIKFSDIIVYEDRLRKWLKPGGKRTQSMFYFQTKGSEINPELVFDPTIDLSDLPVPTPGTPSPNF
ncbi:hypothetical protein HP439_13045 [Sphingobacterium shayense]|uniref:DUF5906 domain-containing protein n=1 Tax=Sphingobacterium shayense TaxID=626343 RepID=UPI00155759E8|nr:DUF5906 domain-containing protein [Sphingobacterium shayense]NQD71649.1 hypothetical protein [Sphingobacterium shayense]